MKAIIGLGNPGKEYKLTRHNVGYQLLDVIAKNKKISFKKNRFNALCSEYTHESEKVLLVKPLSYMNLSGGVVKKIIDYYKLSLDDILIIQDDLDMNLGRIKIVFDSSSGGHNGIKDIEKSINSQKYLRLKIGISRDQSITTKDYVLENFGVSQREILMEKYNELKNISDDFCSLSRDQLMSKYNKK